MVSQNTVEKPCLTTIPVFRCNGCGLSKYLCSQKGQTLKNSLQLFFSEHLWNLMKTFSC